MKTLLMLLIVISIIGVMWTIYFMLYLPCTWVKEYPYFFYRDVPVRCLDLK